MNVFLFFLLYFQFILVLEAAHVAYHYLVARLEAADHFYILEVGITQFHFALHNLVFAIQYEKFIVTPAHIIRSVGDAHYIFLYGIHHIDIGLQTRAQTLVAIVGQLHAKRNHPILGKRSHTAYCAFQL